MDIAGLSTALSMNRTMNDVGIAVLSKQLDANKDAGQAMIASMNAMPGPSESSVNPSVGSHIDISV
ncbi:YjfB family protein [Butyrivibrio sp. MC2013]|uniref:YjfB family protein n=1 Tax=Butyrivibrio sp. MC2013 TaxID=1280686 RepID=UPI0004270C59|nr:YjfB family protein [Butyrivibrio sp. MC2013]